MFRAFSSFGVQRQWQRQVYSERAFRYLLALERRRTVYPTRWCVLALVRLKKSADATGTRMPPGLADSIVSNLAACTRDVDFIGWYREDRIVGAVLAQSAGQPAHVSNRLAARLTQVLCSALPNHVCGRVQVRTVHVGRRSTGD